jgi:hypothetical protein
VVIETRLEAASGDATALGVESELREALVNLVLNAIDAMPEGGRLTLRAGRDGTGDDARIFIEVTDTGVGMDEDTRQRCLEPFFTDQGRTRQRPGTRHGLWHRPAPLDANRHRERARPGHDVPPDIPVAAAGHFRIERRRRSAGAGAVAHPADRR